MADTSMGSADGEDESIANALVDDGEPRGLARLEERLGVRFADPRLLRRAFVHSSVLNERPDYELASNERLEFLGDAFLSFIVADYLHAQCPDLPEGDLTLRRAAIVCTDTLARLAGDLGLGELLTVSRGEDQRGGRQRRRVLAGTLEALIGAVFLDQGYALGRAFVLRLVRSALERLPLEGITRDHKSQLQMRVQSERHVAPVYRTAGEIGLAHAREFLVEVLVEGEVWGRGGGLSKRAAEQEAARQALAAGGPQEPAMTPGGATDNEQALGVPALTQPSPRGRGLWADEPEGGAG